jgi:putative ABC transport system ATP-binding protein
MAGTAPNMTIEENLAHAHLCGSSRGLRSGVTMEKRSLFVERLQSLELGLEQR